MEGLMRVRSWGGANFYTNLIVAPGACPLLLQFPTWRLRSSETPLRAITGLMHRSKNARYSITSSARASSVGGTVSPSALAVLKLMISSTFTACWTGRSAGWAALKPNCQGVVAPVCQMPRRRGGIIRPPLTRAYSRGRRFCAERCRCDCANCIAGP